MEKNFIKTTPDSGRGTADVTVTALPNTSLKERSESITISPNTSGGGVSNLTSPKLGC